MDPERAELTELLQPLLSNADIAGGIPPSELDHGAPGESRSVRSAEYAGRMIRVETTYRIYFDDQLFPDPIHVNDDGSVHYHGLPQYSVPSAVELCKLIVDHLSEGPPPPLIGEGDGPPDGHDHGDHDHGDHR